MTMSHINRHCDAFLSAVENVRDCDFEPEKYGPAATTLEKLDEIAAGYIADGMSKCTCPAAVNAAREIKPGDLCSIQDDGTIKHWGCEQFADGTVTRNGKRVPS